MRALKRPMPSIMQQRTLQLARQSDQPDGLPRRKQTHPTAFTFQYLAWISGERNHCWRTPSVGGLLGRCPWYFEGRQGGGSVPWRVQVQPARNEPCGAEGAAIPVRRSRAHGLRVAFDIICARK
jgi:hypothetical protein